MKPAAATRCAATASSISIPRYPSGSPCRGRKGRTSSSGGKAYNVTNTVTMDPGVGERQPDRHIHLRQVDHPTGFSPRQMEFALRFNF